MPSMSEISDDRCLLLKLLWSNFQKQIMGMWRILPKYHNSPAQTRSVGRG